MASGARLKVRGRVAAPTGFLIRQFCIVPGGLAVAGYIKAVGRIVADNVSGRVARTVAPRGTGR